LWCSARPGHLGTVTVRDTGVWYKTLVLQRWSLAGTPTATPCCPGKRESCRLVESTAPVCLVPPPPLGIGNWPLVIRPRVGRPVRGGYSLRLEPCAAGSRTVARATSRVPVGFRYRPRLRLPIPLGPCPYRLSLSPRQARALHRRGVPDIRSIGCQLSSACRGGRARKWWVASAGWDKRRFSLEDRRFVSTVPWGPEETRRGIGWQGRLGIMNLAFPQSPLPVVGITLG
jgi:hypothetical protein